MSYCTAVAAMTGLRKELHGLYHDYHYGFPIKEDNELFGRLILEINQAGLNWETMLKKEAAFREAFDEFKIATVAAYGAADIERLLNNAGIIRNRLKIMAVIYNAAAIVKLQEEHGSFYQWLEKHHPLEKEEWVKLFKKHFKFVGGEIVGEFLMSTGFLPGAHDETCVIYQKIKKAEPAWMRNMK